VVDKENYLLALLDRDKFGKADYSLMVLDDISVFLLSWVVCQTK
jgi:hypothetical protein